MEYRCGKCKQTKDQAEFASSQRKTGAWCRICMRKKKGPHPSRPCQQCGTVMEDPNPKAIFCSVVCKNRAKAARLHQEFLDRSAQRACENCGTSLVGRSTASRWCSEKCASKRPTRKAVARRAHLKANYGITEDQFNRLLKVQRARCAVCKSDDPKHSKGQWAIDHDHVTGRVRGLLCSKCNTGIGQLRDDPEILTAAARYIRRHRRKVLSL